jgi:hypothetical protein
VSRQTVAPEFVQTGFHVAWMGLSCPSARHFHTVFNKTVEKFHGIFIISAAFLDRVERQLLRSFAASKCSGMNREASQHRFTDAQA